MLTGYDGYRIDSVESGEISRPLGRILARHPHLSETIRAYADPVALVIAVGAVTVPRVAAHRAMIAMMRPAPQSPPTAVPNGTPPNGQAVNPWAARFAEY